MTKLLLFLAVALVAYWLWFRPGRPRSGAPPPTRETEAIVACAHCGIHVPLSEAIQVGGQSYCCEEHRGLGPRH